MNEAIRVVLNNVSTRICMATTCTILTMHSESAILEAGLCSSDVEVNKPGLRLQRRLWMLAESWAAGGKLQTAVSRRRSSESHMAHEDAPRTNPSTARYSPAIPRDSSQGARVGCTSHGLPHDTLPRGPCGLGGR